MSSGDYPPTPAERRLVGGLSVGQTISEANRTEAVREQLRKVVAERDALRAQVNQINKERDGRLSIKRWANAWLCEALRRAHKDQIPWAGLTDDPSCHRPSGNEIIDWIVTLEKNLEMAHETTNDIVNLFADLVDDIEAIGSGSSPDWRNRKNVVRARSYFTSLARTQYDQTKEA